MMHRHFPLLEDRPPFVPTWGFRVKRFLLACEIPLAFALTLALIVAGACFLMALWAVIP